MKVGLSAIITPPEWTFDQLIREAQANGYEALEVCLASEGELSLQTSEKELQAMASRASAAGIELASVCAQVRQHPKDIMTNDRQIWEASLDTIRRCVDATAALGVDTMLLTLGALHDDLYYNEAYANALRALQILAPYAEQAGVNLAVEYVWNKFLLSPLEFARFCDEVGSPRVGFYFDTGNMAIFGYPQHWARICGKHIMKVHLKDFKRQGYQWTPLLEGDVNFPAVMAELRKIGYNDALISEVAPSIAPLAETAAAIRQILTM